MRVTVEYFGPARDAAGVGREVIEVKASVTATELVERIARERAGRLTSLLLVEGKLSRSLLLTVNDRQVSLPETVALVDGDVVSIIPPVSGGAT
jgi:molybdopterin converting factor small subunit